MKIATTWSAARVQFASALLVGFFGCGADLEVRSEMATLSRILDIVEAVVAHRSGGVKYFEHQLGLHFERSSRSDESLDIFVSGSSRLHAPIKSVELRVAKKAANSGLIVLNFDSGQQCVSRDEVFARFGKSPKVSVPTPRQPPGSPVYYVYGLNWGELRIGVSETPRECVETAVLDYSG